MTAVSAILWAALVVVGSALTGLLLWVICGVLVLCLAFGAGLMAARAGIERSIDRGVLNWRGNSYRLSTDFEARSRRADQSARNVMAAIRRHDSGRQR